MSSDEKSQEHPKKACVVRNRSLEDQAGKGSTQDERHINMEVR
jgi:hypothetical protein